MKDKVVNKLLEALFSGDKSEEDMVYVQVKFVLEVLLNNLGKLAVVLVFSLVTGSWAEQESPFFLYLHPQICLWIAFRLWIRLSAVDTTLFMGRSLGDETSAIDYLLPNDGLFVNQLLFVTASLWIKRYSNQSHWTQKRPPLLKKAISMFLIFSLITLFFSASYFSTYLLLGIVLEIATLLPITNYLMNFGGIFHEKNNH